MVKRPGIQKGDLVRFRQVKGTTTQFINSCGHIVRTETIVFRTTDKFTVIDVKKRNGLTILMLRIDVVGGSRVLEGVLSQQVKRC